MINDNDKWECQWEWEWKIKMIMINENVNDISSIDIEGIRTVFIFLWKKF